ncbi:MULTISPECIES: MBL fold metallo-hydrolase [unclassified Bradyrhizobium]|uniref:MBL fold metallo-hydrolase n=1 Tax=unclassified Bradyrhizobium TaxID=2631580 RepID=UPI001FFFBBB9|nr:MULTISPECIES: MBL fold metallo-hydrolase [unclassified Bradyrhizobium]
MVILCFQSYVVRTPHHTILVDSCVGNDKPRRRSQWNLKSEGTYMQSLARAGLSVEDIDYVMCTHLHDDHVGWNTRRVNGEWVPTFPNARYIFHERELEGTRRQHALQPQAWACYEDSVVPILQQGRADIVRDGFEVGDHVRLLPTPGHTDGHVAVCFGKKRDEAVVTGDLVHLPLQLRYPELLSYFGDRDPALGARTRRDFLERYCDTPTLCCTAHFPSPSAGHLSRWGDGYRINYD